MTRSRRRRDQRLPGLAGRRCCHADCDPVVVLNPRRSEFDLASPEATAEQIGWEVANRKHPRLSYMLFWFPASNSVQPISLLELGAALARPELPIVIGAAPGYLRRTDVVLQCRSERPDLVVHDQLSDTITELRALLNWTPATT
ncbi:hypothetical protein ACFV9C_43840 [Kribbella sp. NPDC059898]|uniref:hypothetical protein n=1 Tax=Kribbella sp. NPDC059898 TaxID=3346995 RepID=UPI00365A2D12